MLCGTWCRLSQTPVCMLVWRQGAHRVLGSVICSSLGLPTPKAAEGFAETWTAALAPTVWSWGWESTVSRGQESISELPIPWLGFELIFLPPKDFYLCSSILSYNKTSLILGVDNHYPHLFRILGVQLGDSCVIWPGIFFLSEGTPSVWRRKNSQGMWLLSVALRAVSKADYFLWFQKPLTLDQSPLSRWWVSLIIYTNLGKDGA